MKTEIEVKDREEAKQIKLALDDAETRAFVKVIGILKRLPSKRKQELVLNFVYAMLEEEREKRNGLG